MRFKFLTGDVNWQTYGGKFVSKRLVNGYDGPGAVKGEDYDFHYYMVMEVRPNEDYERGGRDPAYWVCLSVVSPEAAGPDEIKRAVAMHGVDDEELMQNELFLVDCLHGYGVYALIWEGEGNNLAKLMKEARNQARLAEMMFGFYMDAPQNGVGSTGWDTVRGDLWAGARRSAR